MSNLVQYMERAAANLRSAGIDIFSVKGETSALIPLLEKAAFIDEAKVLAVAQVLNQYGPYNNLVRDNISAMNISDRYNAIAKAFDSALEDSKMIIEHEADGKITFSERAQQAWMRATRGDIWERYDKGIKIFNEVSQDLGEQVKKETAILDAYKLFRLQVGTAVGWTHELREAHNLVLAEAETKWKNAQTALDTAVDIKDSEKISLKVARDEASFQYQDAKKLNDLLKAVANDMENTYNVGDAVMGKLETMVSQKDAMYKRGISFKTTHEPVFLGMSATHASMLGANEHAEAMGAMTNGMNKGLEYLADATGKVQEKMIQVTHGKTVDATSFEKFVNAMVEFKSTELELANTVQKDADETTRRISQIAENGKRSMEEIVLNYNTQRKLE